MNPSLKLISCAVHSAMRANKATALHLKRRYFFKQMFFMSELYMRLLVLEALEFSTIYSFCKSETKTKRDLVLL